MTVTSFLLFAAGFICGGFCVSWFGSRSAEPEYQPPEAKTLVGVTKMAENKEFEVDLDHRIRRDLELATEILQSPPKEETDRQPAIKRQPTVGKADRPVGG